MEREIMKNLLFWKNKENRKPLILTGVRQCGKTYILKKFGEKHFKNCIYINLERDPQISDIFNYNFNVKRIIQDISNLCLIPEFDINTTLLIIDEIQFNPKAITSLKYFYEDLPQLAVIGAGSLLGVSIREEGASFPVGKVERLQMYPMNFKEFLFVIDNGTTINRINENKLDEPLPNYLLDKLNTEYTNYLFVGGMPEVVKSWINNKNLVEVNKIQDDIISGYENDFSRHCPKNELSNIKLIWHSIPEQLAKENNKFVFSRVKKSARAKDLEKSITWLIDAGLIHVVSKIKSPQIPLSFSNDSSAYKVYLSDVGLLTRIANFTLRSLMEKDEATGGFRGSLSENYINNELVSQGYKTYFWRSDNSAELDFLIENDNKIIPIEVKANMNTKAKSYDVFVKKYKPEIGFKFSLLNIGVNEKNDNTSYSLPLALAYEIGKYIAK